MDANPTLALRPALAFWERGRILYNAILAAIVLLWVALSWPHFRPALTLGSFEAFVVLGLLANLCYSAAYVAELFTQPFLSGAHLRRFRRILWLLGMLFAILLENYWIADEIYPYVTQPPPAIFGGNTAMPAIASNMNFPAPFAVVGFLTACVGLFLALAAVFIFWFARKPKFARTAAYAIVAGALCYAALLLGFSAASRATTLTRGQEKYFCEIDCHLAYSIVEVNTHPDGPSTRYLITLRTRFDETTTSPSRPKDVPLTPSAREVLLVDASGRQYPPVTAQGAPLLTPLTPATSYTTQLEFKVPSDATGLKLLLRTTPAWPDHFVIGNENSLLHQKTYFAL